MATRLIAVLPQQLQPLPLLQHAALGITQQTVARTDRASILCSPPQPPFATRATTMRTGDYTPFKDHSYNWSQARLSRRFGGSQVGVVYTFQKAISYSDDEELQSTLFTLPSAYEKNRGPSRFDRTP